MLAFHHEKIFEKFNRVGDVYFNTWFQRLQCIVSWPCCARALWLEWHVIPSSSESKADLLVAANTKGRSRGTPNISFWVTPPVIYCPPMRPCLLNAPPTFQRDHLRGTNPQCGILCGTFKMQALQSGLSLRGETGS